MIRRVTFAALTAFAVMDAAALPLGARTATWSGESSPQPVPFPQETPLDYVQDGLICMYDGWWNAGISNFNATATTWRNLGSLGVAYDAVRSSGVFNPGHAVIVAGDELTRFSIEGALMSTQMKGEWSYEIVFEPKNWSAYMGVLGNHNSSRKGIIGGQNLNGKVSFTLYPPEVPLWIPAASTFVGDACSVSQCASSSNRTAVTYFGSEIVSSHADVDVVLSNPSQFFIGSAFPGKERVFNGKVYCLRIYNRQLTAEEVAANYAIDRARFNLP